MVQALCNEKDEAAGVLVLKGELAIQKMQEIKDRLLSAIGSGRHVEIRMEEVSEVDLSFMQLLCAAHRYALKQGGGVSIEGDLPDVLKELARVAGYTRHTGCVLDSQKSCLWVRQWS